MPGPVDHNGDPIIFGTWYRRLVVNELRCMIRPGHPPALANPDGNGCRYVSAHGELGYCHGPDHVPHGC